MGLSKKGPITPFKGSWADTEQRRKKHKLIIKSLHDAHAECSCGGWSLVRTGSMDRKEIERAHAQHAGDWSASGAGKRRRPEKAISSITGPGYGYNMGTYEGMKSFKSFCSESTGQRFVCRTPGRIAVIEGEAR